MGCTVGHCDGCGSATRWATSAPHLCPRCLDRERSEAWQRQVLREPPAAVEPVSRELGEPEWGERAFGFEPREPHFWERLRSWWTRPKRERLDNSDLDALLNGRVTHFPMMEEAAARARLPRPLANPDYVSTVKK